jgi:hypothetical protein
MSGPSWGLCDSRLGAWVPQKPALASPPESSFSLGGALLSLPPCHHAMKFNNTTNCVHAAENGSPGGEAVAETRASHFSHLNFLKIFYGGAHL